MIKELGEPVGESKGLQALSRIYPQFDDENKDQTMYIFLTPPINADAIRAVVDEEASIVTAIKCYEDEEWRVLGGE